MPRIPRKLLIDPTQPGVFHCISRCVRRAFLCGEDRLTGRNFDYRRQWIQDRLTFLAGQFGIDVLGFAVMANHLHVVLRNRPDVVSAWSDDEVARRWWNVFPLRRDDDGNPAEPEALELSLVTGSPACFSWRSCRPVGSRTGNYRSSRIGRHPGLEARLRGISRFHAAPLD